MRCVRLSPMRSSSSWARHSRCSWAGCWCFVLAWALCLPTWPASAQSSPPISPLGPANYQSFKVDILTISFQLTASRQALETALSENASIRESLRKAEESAMQHSRDSTNSSEADLQELARLRQRLNESDALVVELRQSLESAKAEYAQKLKKAQARARALERENRLLKIGLGVAGAAVLGLGIYAAVK